MVLTNVCGFWFARYLICAGETILKGPKRKTARAEEMWLGSQQAGEAATNMKYIATNFKAGPAYTARLFWG